MFFNKDIISLIYNAC